MAETPDIWPSGWPEARASAPPVRPIGGQAPRFGVARELDVPAPPKQSAGAQAKAARRSRRIPPAAPRERTGSRVGSWWACRETHPSDLWHRMQCRSGRHQIEGGKQIQLGSRLVNTERCCRWCGLKP